MSNIPYAMPGARDGYRMGNQTVTDLMIHDGLWCPFENWHMGNTGEVVAEKYHITREAQDEFAAASHQKAAAAQAAGRFADEIVPIEIPQKKATPSCSRLTNRFARTRPLKVWRSSSLHSNATAAP